MIRERLHDLWLRLKAVVKRRQLDRDLAEELEFHLAMREQKLIEQGMPPREAHYAARRGFGNPVSLKESSRDLWSFPSLETFLQDVRFGLRMLAKNRGFTAVAVLTVALGIGGTTAIFSVLYTGLINPLPYANGDRLVVLVTHNPKDPQLDDWAYVSPAEFLDIAKQNRVFDQVIGALRADVLLTGRDTLPESFIGFRLTPNAFQVLGMAPVIGRTFTSEDTKPWAPPAVVLSYKVWQSEFSGSARILGQTIFLNHQPTTIIGVMPPRFRLFGTGVWLPWDFAERAKQTPVLGRLKPGVTIAQASADLELLAKNLAAVYPDSHPKDTTCSVMSFTQASVAEESGRTLRFVMGGVGLLLLIACVNVANLLLARASGREKEIAIRASLGAGRRRLVRQLMIESLLLALGGASLGILLALNGLTAIVAIIPIGFLPFEAEVRINGWVMLFAAGAVLVSTLVFGLAPAVLAVKKDFQASLAGSSRGTGETRGQQRFRNLLLVIEVALSLVLLTGAGLLFRSFWTLRHIELGYNVDNMLQARGYLWGERYKRAEQRNQFHTEALRRIRGLPSVASATLSFPDLDSGAIIPIEIVGQSTAESQSVWYHLVGDGFFETAAIPLVQGRTISEEDLIHARPVAVVNRAFVNKFMAGTAPLGRQIKVTPPSWLGVSQAKNEELEIVGVVADTRHVGDTMELLAKPQVLFPTTLWGPPFYEILVRTVGNPANLVNTVRQEFASIDKELPVEVAPVRDDFQPLYAEPKFVLGLLMGFAGLGLTLACIGVYSVLAYALSRRTQEIGIRMALGAEAPDVHKMVMKSGLRWLLVGVGVGGAASIALAKIFQNRIWGIKSADPLTLAAVSVLLIAVGLAACYFPARRATKVDPMAALRCE
jgi:putative ABC transport system permease protein